MARQPRASLQAFKTTSPGELLWDLLTFDRLVTGPVIHIIYWAGLLVCVLAGFSVVGGAFGIALKEPGLMALALALPVLVGGLLVIAAMALIWRAFCEFYVALFRISDDLQAIRAAAEAGVSTALTPAAPPASSAPVAAKSAAKGDARIDEEPELFDARPTPTRRGAKS